MYIHPIPPFDQLIIVISPQVIRDQSNGGKISHILHKSTSIRNDSSMDLVN